VLPTLSPQAQLWTLAFNSVRQPSLAAPSSSIGLLVGGVAVMRTVVMTPLFTLQLPLPITRLVFMASKEDLRARRFDNVCANVQLAWQEF